MFVWSEYYYLTRCASFPLGKLAHRVNLVKKHYDGYGPCPHSSVFYKYDELGRIKQINLHKCKKYSFDFTYDDKGEPTISSKGYWWRNIWG